MIPIRIAGAGHAVGSRVERNRDVAERLGLKSNWFEKRTLISERRVANDGESALSMAVASIRAACDDAGLDIAEAHKDSVVLYLQNGFTYLTPPPGILLAHALGADRLRVISIDGVCAEPVGAIEMAALMLQSGTYRHVIVCASVDFIPAVDVHDLETAGLFGAGAGAAVFELREDGRAGGLGILRTYQDAGLWDLGRIEIVDHAISSDGLDVRFDFYRMNGPALAKIALTVVPKFVASVLEDSGWTAKQIDLVIGHQPNGKLVEMGAKRLKVALSKIEVVVNTMGNMGPATMMVALSVAKQKGKLTPGTRVLFVAFGLGFSCGAATFTV
jgi:3-oxoacyl-[acyl-carrier-protein] synthase-3